MAHSHKAQTERTVAWTHCVSADRGCSGRSHGGVTFVESCRCGAERKIESNGGSVGRGRWITADEA